MRTMNHSDVHSPDAGLTDLSTAVKLSATVLQSLRAQPAVAASVGQRYSLMIPNMRL